MVKLIEADIPVRILLSEAKLRDVYEQYKLTDEEKLYFNQIIEKQRHLQKYMPHIIKFIKEDGYAPSVVFEIFNLFEKYKDVVPHKDFMDAKYYSTLLDFRQAIKVAQREKKAAVIGGVNPSVVERIENGLKQFSTTTFLVSETDEYWVIYIGSFPASVYFCEEPRKQTSKLGGPPWCIGAQEGNYNNYHRDYKSCFLIQPKDGYMKSTIFYASATALERTDIMNTMHYDEGPWHGVLKVIRENEMVKKIWEVRRAQPSLAIKDVSFFVISGIPVGTDSMKTIETLIEKEGITLTKDEWEEIKKSPQTVLSRISSCPSNKGFFYWIAYAGIWPEYYDIYCKGSAKLYDSKLPFKLKVDLVKAGSNYGTHLMYSFGTLMSKLGDIKVDDFLDEATVATLFNEYKKDNNNTLELLSQLNFDTKEEKLIDFIRFAVAHPKLLRSPATANSIFHDANAHLAHFTANLMLQTLQLLEKKVKISDILKKLVPETDYETKIIAYNSMGLPAWEMTQENLVNGSIEAVAEIEKNRATLKKGYSIEYLKLYVFTYPELLPILLSEHNYAQTFKNFYNITAETRDKFVKFYVSIPQSYRDLFEKILTDIGYTTDTALVESFMEAYKADASFLDEKQIYTIFKHAINNYGNGYFSWINGPLQQLFTDPAVKNPMSNAINFYPRIFRPIEGTANFKKIIQQYNRFQDAVRYASSHDVRPSSRTWGNNLTFEMLQMYTDQQLTNMYMLTNYLSFSPDNETTQEVIYMFSNEVVAAFVASNPKIKDINKVGLIFFNLKKLLKTEEKMLEYLKSNVVNDVIADCDSLEALETLGKFGAFLIAANKEKFEKFLAETKEWSSGLIKYLLAFQYGTLDNGVIDAILRHKSVFEEAFKTSTFKDFPNSLVQQAYNMFSYNVYHGGGLSNVETIKLFLSMDFKNLIEPLDLAKQNNLWNWMAYAVGRTSSYSSSMPTVGSPAAVTSITKLQEMAFKLPKLIALAKQLTRMETLKRQDGGVKRLYTNIDYILAFSETLEIGKILFDGVYDTPTIDKKFAKVASLNLKHPGYAMLHMLHGVIKAEVLKSLDEYMPAIMTILKWDYAKLQNLLGKINISDIAEASQNNTLEELLSNQEYIHITLPNCLYDLLQFAEDGDYHYGIAINAIPEVGIATYSNTEVSLVALHKTIKSKSIVVILKNHRFVLPNRSKGRKSSDVNIVIEKFKASISDVKFFDKFNDDKYSGRIELIKHLVPDNSQEIDKVVSHILSTWDNSMKGLGRKIQVYVMFYGDSSGITVNKLLVDFIEANLNAGFLGSLLNAYNYYMPTISKEKKTRFWYIAGLACVFGVKNNIDVAKISGWTPVLSQLKMASLTFDLKDTIKQIFNLRVPLLTSIEKLEISSSNKHALKTLMNLEGIEQW
jgi:hypothetical protein